MEELRQLLLQSGSALVGYANLSIVPSEHRLNMRYGISIAVALSPVIVSNIRHGPTKEYYAEYCKVNNLLDHLSIKAANFLQDRGWKAKSFAATNEGIFPETLSTCLPHKTVATLAGLGWIGKCALLITEKYGSAVRISTVLTDAELTSGQPITMSKCGDCRICVDACPAHAATGELWEAGLYRDTFFNPFNCRKTARKYAANAGIDDTVCGICIAVCPWTRKYIESFSNTKYG
jgi:epoxyqueuosine reductase QueG